MKFEPWQSEVANVFNEFFENENARKRQLSTGEENKMDTTETKTTNGRILPNQKFKQTDESVFGLHTYEQAHAVRELTWNTLKQLHPKQADRFQIKVRRRPDDTFDVLVFETLNRAVFNANAGVDSYTIDMSDKLKKPASKKEERAMRKRQKIEVVK